MKLYFDWTSTGGLAGNFAGWWYWMVDGSDEIWKDLPDEDTEAVLEWLRSYVK